MTDAGPSRFCTVDSVEFSTVHIFEEHYLIVGVGDTHGPKGVKGRSVGRSVELFLCFKICLKLLIRG